MKAWKRTLIVTLTSTQLKKKLIFGGQAEDGKVDLSMNITIHKYMSSLKDEAVIRIDNLTYAEVTLIQMGKFYDVDIYAGYQKANSKIFSGGVLYISNKLNGDRTNTIVILCGSRLVARFGQSRMNLSLNSGINMYSAIKFICRRNGITDGNISTQFKKKFLTEVATADDSVASWIDKLTKNNNTAIVNSDSIFDQTFSIFDAAKSNSRVIKLNSDSISLVGGPPRLTTEGLSVHMLPTFNFMCGDVIKIDNSIIDISVESTEEIQKNYGALFSQKGEYLIYEISYSLSNRENDFKLTLKCKNRDRVSSYIGVQ